MKPLVSFVIGLSCWLIGVSDVRAQPAVQLNAYRSGELASDGFATSRPSGLGHLRVAAQLSVDYSHRPLVVSVANAAATSNVAVVAHQLTGNLALAFGLFDRITLFGGMPLNLVMDGQNAPGVPNADGFGLSDAWFGVRAQLFGGANEVLALGFQATVTVPTADYAHAEQRYSGDIGISVLPELLVELRLPASIRFALHAGARLRGEDQANVVSTLPVSHELVWGAGVFVPVWVPDDTTSLSVHLESFGRHTVARFGTRGLGSIEGLFGVKLKTVSGLWFGVAVGTTLMNGYGSPSVRTLATVGWAEPFVDAPVPVEPTPVEVAVAPEAPPAAPAPVDSDGDGIRDEDDADPSAPEDIDGFEDSDGAPELDNDGDNIPDAVDRCPIEVGVSPHGCPGVDMAQITFARGSDRLAGEGVRALSGIVTTLAQHPEIEVVQVEGHSDESGEPSANLALSLRRAAAVRRQLMRRGVAAERLEAAGCGEHYPMGENHDANRRVQFWSHARGDGLREGCIR